MPETQQFAIVWLTGASCDGCTIKALGDTTAGGIEALLSGSVPGLPPIRLIHSLLSPETGEEFVRLLRAAALGELGSFGLVVESSVPGVDVGTAGMFPTMGDEGGVATSVGSWLDRLASRAAFVVAWGDCAVWGGPHAIGANPMGASGVACRLGWDYRSACGLPVVHLPGCAPPPLLISTVVTILRWLQGDGPPPELDDLHRPRARYDGPWKGAFTAWSA